MTKRYYDETEIRRALSVVVGDGNTFECRVLGSKTYSGYFQSADVLLQELQHLPLHGAQVYVTLQGLDESLHSRQQSDRFLAVKDATQDKDANIYRWLLVDVDPERTKGVSSSQEELEDAHQIAQQIYRYMSQNGFTSPVVACSGNGYHLLYPVNMAATKENAELLKKVLQSLDMMFSTEACKVDTVNFNPSRICKLYGTLAQKGRSTEKRPHRMSRMLVVPDTIVPISKDALKKIILPELEQPAPEPANYNRYNPTSFEVVQWMAEHKIEYKETAYGGGTKYVLNECPFCGHKAPDSAVFKLPSGALGFRCLHNSCSGKTWRDFRIFYDPTAYEEKQRDSDRRIEDGWHRKNADLKNQGQKSSEKVFETLADIAAKPDVEKTFVQTGIRDIDRKIHGLEKGKLSIMTGLRGSGKSTILSQITLQAIDNCQRVISYSGELTDKNLASWLYLQAAGKEGVVASSSMQNFYTVPNEVKKTIAEAVGDKLLIYNNSHGHDWDGICKALFDTAKQSCADLIIIDNLMTIDITGPADMRYYDKMEVQTGFVRTLKTLAAETNAHVLLVAHPRKAMGLLRLDDIAGTGNLTNYVDTAFIIHRVNADFRKRSQQEFCWKNDNEIYTSGCTNVIEICKDRETGVQDEWVKLWYEAETKRMLNSRGDFWHYSWEELPSGFAPYTGEF